MRNPLSLLLSVITTLFLVAMNPAMATEADGNPDTGAGTAGAENCWLFVQISGLACGIGGSFDLNLSGTSVTSYKVVAVTGGHIVQATSSINNIAGLIAYAALPSADGKPGSPLDPIEDLRCGPIFVWMGAVCGPFVAFTVPGTTGGIQQYGFGWRAMLTVPDKDIPTLSIGIGADYTAEASTLDPNIVSPNGMVNAADDAAVAAGTLLPTRNADRWGVLFMLTVQSGP
jgi:hypothetical protein